MGSVPGRGKSHMTRSNRAHVSQLLSLCSGARGLQLLKPMHPGAHAPPRERPLQQEPPTATKEKPSSEDLAQPKIRMNT